MIQLILDTLNSFPQNEINESLMSIAYQLTQFDSDEASNKLTCNYWSKLYKSQIEQVEKNLREKIPHGNSFIYNNKSTVKMLSEDLLLCAEDEQRELNLLT